MRETYRILAENKMISNDTRKTGLNNNDLVIGISGAGKTRSYVKPNILQCNESMIVVDTKNSLYQDTKEVLEKAGYDVWLLDLTDMVHSPAGYNPLSAIRYDEMEEEYNEQDIAAVAMALCPAESEKDPFWDYAARLQLEALIAYVLEALPAEEQNLVSVARLQGMMQHGSFEQLFEELAMTKKNSIAVRKWQLFAGTKRADKTNTCIRLMLDDFAANAVIPDFDKIISVIRSREIYVSVIIQSLSQLYSMYGQDKAKTIVNNCDNLLYLGGQDVETAEYIGVKANKTANTILNMPVGDAVLFTRGETPCQVKKYDPRHYECGEKQPATEKTEEEIDAIGSGYMRF